MVTDLWVEKPIGHLNEMPIRLHDPTFIVRLDHPIDMVHLQAV